MKKFVSLMLICIFAIGMLSVGAFAADCDHQWAESDTSNGVTTYLCVLCGGVKTEAAAPEAPCAHSWEDSNVLVHGNCGVDGVVDQLCVLCGEHQRVTTPATGDHDWDRDEKAPTCEGTGSYYQVCKVCGKQESGSIPALGHAWDNGVVTTEPTCEGEGVLTKTCATCGGTKTEAIAATGHTAEVVPAVAPTCTETGLTEGSKCAVCGKTLVAQEEVAALGHTAEVVPAVAPTCTETGLTEGSKCAVCGETLVAQEEVAAIGHAWDEGKVTVKPTTKSEGVRTYTCTNGCGETKTESIPKLPASDKTLSPGTGSSYFYMMIAVLVLCTGFVAITSVSKKHSKN